MRFTRSIQITAALTGLLLATTGCKKEMKPEELATETCKCMEQTVTNLLKLTADFEEKVTRQNAVQEHALLGKHYIEQVLAVQQDCMNKLKERPDAKALMEGDGAEEARKQLDKLRSQCEKPLQDTIVNSMIAIDARLRAKGILMKGGLLGGTIEVAPDSTAAAHR